MNVLRLAGLMLTLLYGRNGWFAPLIRATNFPIVFAFPGMNCSLSMLPEDHKFAIKAFHVTCALPVNNVKARDFMLHVDMFHHITPMTYGASFTPKSENADVLTPNAAIDVRLSEMVAKGSKHGNTECICCCWRC